jgi:hypothetical protein
MAFYNDKELHFLFAPSYLLKIELINGKLD